MLHLRSVHYQLQTFLPAALKEFTSQRHDFLRAERILIGEFMITAIIRSIVDQRLVIEGILAIHLWMPVIKMLLFLQQPLPLMFVKLVQPAA